MLQGFELSLDKLELRQQLVVSKFGLLRLDHETNDLGLALGGTDDACNRLIWRAMVANGVGDIALIYNLDVQLVLHLSLFNNLL